MAKGKSEPEKVFVIGGPEDGKEYVVPRNVEILYVTMGGFDLGAKDIPGDLKLAEYQVKTPPWNTSKAALFNGYITGEQARECLERQLKKQKNPGPPLGPGDAA